MYRAIVLILLLVSLVMSVMNFYKIGREHYTDHDPSLSQDSSPEKICYSEFRNCLNTLGPEGDCYRRYSYCVDSYQNPDSCYAKCYNFKTDFAPDYHFCGENCDKCGKVKCESN